MYDYYSLHIDSLSYACLYHTLHLLVGFIGDPSGHPYASEKSFEFDSGPSTLTNPGECTDERILVSASSGRIDPHHICA